MLKGSRRAEEEEKVGDGEPGMHSKTLRGHAALRAKVSPAALALTVQKWELSQEAASFSQNKQKKIHGGKIRWEIAATVLLLCYCVHAMTVLSTQTSVR